MRYAILFSFVLISLYSLTQDSILTVDTSFHENGQLYIIQQVYINSEGEHIKEGFCFKYDRSGNLTEKGNLHGNVIRGKWKTYHKNGALKSEGRYSLGNHETSGTDSSTSGYEYEKIGGWAYYNDVGQVLKTEIWLNGSLLYDSTQND